MNGLIELMLGAMLGIALGVALIYFVLNPLANHLSVVAVTTPAPPAVIDHSAAVAVAWEAWQRQDQNAIQNADPNAIILVSGMPAATTTQKDGRGAGMEPASSYGPSPQPRVTETSLRLKIVPRWCHYQVLSVLPFCTGAHAADAAAAAAAPTEVPKSARAVMQIQNGRSDPEDVARVQ